MGGEASVVDVLRWDPYDELRRVGDWFQRYALAGTAPWLDPWRPRAGLWGPSVDVEETDDQIIVRAEIPGANPGDLDVQITEDSLSLQGEVRQETGTNARGFRRIERRYGAFQRTIPFPVPVEHERATATYRNGILEVRAPKAAAGRGRARKLPIQAADGPQDPGGPGQLQ
ncbi:MAG TPA: Hsp20/alpha crystallin family protein [Limnochordales bacterium]|nr:Hsp20/alpha crystallin family protein [Limnochordales bacterium]